MHAVSPSLFPGDRLAGRYDIVEQVGAGGMGTVYRAIDTAAQRVVAIKIVGVASRTDVLRFEREAATLRRVDHPAVVRYLDHGTEHGAHYLVMEWLAGRMLDDHLAEAGISPAESVALVARIAAGLAAVHACGLVHRDIKPDNLMLIDGVLERVAILDFGVARPTTIIEIITHTGRAVGTPGYMSPEQTRGERGVDARSDIFSLGCVLYECLTGRAPFPGEHATAVCAKILLHDPPPLESLWPGAPSGLRTLVEACLSKDRRRRPADAGELVARLAALPAVEPDLPRRPRFRAAPTLGRTATGPALRSILVALPDAGGAPPGLFDLARRAGARAEVLADRTVIVEVPRGAAAAHADILTSLVAALGPAVLAIAAGTSAEARDDLVDRAARAFDAEAIVAALGRARPPLPAGAMRADAETVALLAPPLDVIGGRSTYLLARRDVGSELACAPTAR